jgi:hypothetical protein
VLPTLLTLGRTRRSRAASVIAGTLSLAGAAALKWAIVHAGRDAAEDASLNHAAARADAAHAGWTPEVDVRTGVLAAVESAG